MLHKAGCQGIDFYPGINCKVHLIGIRRNGERVDILIALTPEVHMSNEVHHNCSCRSSANNVPPESCQTNKALRILRMKQLIERTGLSRATIYMLMKDPAFPSKIQLTARTIGVYEHQFEAWLGSRSQLHAAA